MPNPPEKPPEATPINPWLTWRGVVGVMILGLMFLASLPAIGVLWAWFQIYTANRT